MQCRVNGSSEAGAMSVETEPKLESVREGGREGGKDGGREGGRE